MIRILVSAVMNLAANAVGLLIAAVVLDGMSISGAAFVTAIVIYTVVQTLVGPLIMQLAVKQASALLGGTALVTAFVSLLVTSLVTDGLRIDGLTTWVGATVLVWLGGLLAAVVLPILFVKKKVEERQQTAGRRRL
jgi:putative membrane protein